MMTAQMPGEPDSFLTQHDRISGVCGAAVWKSDYDDLRTYATAKIAELTGEVERLRGERDAMILETGKQIERAEFAERKLAEAVAALKRIASNTCCDTCREAALVAQEAINEATK